MFKRIIDFTILENRSVRSIVQIYNLHFRIANILINFLLIFIILKIMSVVRKAVL